MPYHLEMTPDTQARFRHAYWQVVRELDTERLREWERSHLTLPQLRVLFQVRRTAGITTGELSRTLGVTVSTTSGLVIKLVDRSLIRRDTLEADRRQAGLFLTDEAQQLVSEISESWRPFLTAVSEALGPDLDAVISSLELVAEAAASIRAAADARNESLAR